MNTADVIVIYPGRFHPFHKGHKSVYDLLSKKFKNVYIATSDKVEPEKSPFNFDEKVKIMSMLGIQPDHVLKVRQTYNGNEYINRFDNSYGLIFAVSEKDMDEDPRFNFPAMGMSLKKDGDPAYLQKFTKIEDVQDMTKHGYIMTVPTTTFKVAGHDVNSASQIRSLLGSDNIDDAKQAFVDLYDKYNEQVFNLIRSKLTRENSMENIDINRLRQLAGLNEVDDFDDEKPDDYSDVPGYKEKPMFDQLGKIIDSHEMSKEGDDVKNLITSVKTDDGEEIEVSAGEAQAVKDLMNMLSSQRAGEEESPREKFLDAIQKSQGLHSMIEFAKSKGMVKEGKKKDHDGDGDIDGDDYMAARDKAIKKAMGKKEETDEELNLDDIRADFGVERQKEGKVKDLGMDQAEAFYDKVSALVDDNNDLGKAVVDAWSDEDENPPEWALDDETRAILVNAGKIDPEQEEPAELESHDPQSEPPVSAMSDEDLADFLGCSVDAVKQDREAAEEAAEEKNRDYIPDNMESLEELNAMRKLAGLPESKLNIRGEPEFIYNDKLPHDRNFYEWFMMNQDEYKRANEEYPYDRKTAQRIFDLYWGHKKHLAKSQPELPGMEPSQEEPTPQETGWDRAMRHKGEDIARVKSIKAN